MLKTLPIALICLLLSACTGLNFIPNRNNDVTINHIIVMPVLISDNNSNSTPLSDHTSLITGKEVLGSLVRDYFMGNDKITVLSESQVESYNQGYDNDRQRIKKIGKRLNADAVMTYQISRYVEKDGSDYSVNHPSSVAFSYRLTKIDTGQTLCGSRVDKTQEPLTGNLLNTKRFLRRGGKWISAGQLTKEVLDEKLQECRFLVPPPTTK